MIKAILLDDEPLALQQMKIYAAKIPELNIIAACTSVREAKDNIRKADVIFTDIQMPDMSGLDFVRSLENPPLIVFTTAHPSYAVEGFRVNAIDYLLKPFSLKDFKEAVERVAKVLELTSMDKASSEPQVLHFRTDYKTVTLSIDNILYVESMSEYIKLHLCNEEPPLVVLYSMKHLIEQLPQGKFMRIHRSYIISLSHIKEASASMVNLDGKVSLPVGESYRAVFKEYLSGR